MQSSENMTGTVLQHIWQHSWRTTHRDCFCDVLTADSSRECGNRFAQLEPDMS